MVSLEEFQLPNARPVVVCDSWHLQFGAWGLWNLYGYGSIPINTIFRGMNIHLPAILMFTRGTRF